MSDTTSDKDIASSNHDDISSGSCSTWDSIIIQQRIQQLELLCGLYDSSSNIVDLPDKAGKILSTTASPAITAQQQSTTNTVPSISLEERIQILEKQCKSIQTKVNLDDSTVIDTLYHDLIPGTALTYQKQIVAPIIYRKQEIIASVTMYQKYIYHIQQILHFLSIGQPSTTTTTSTTSGNRSLKMTEQQVLNAPILVVDSQQQQQQPSQEQIDQLSSTILQLQQKAQRIANNIDTMMHQYSNLITAISEKLILIDETITLHEQQQTK